MPGVLPPEAVFARDFAVVRGIDDNGVLEQPIAFQQRQEVSDDLVQKIDAGEVGCPRLHHLIMPDLVGSESLDGPHGHRVSHAVSFLADTRRRYPGRPVALEKAPWGREREVRSAERGVEQPRPIRRAMSVFAQPRQRFSDHHLLLEQRFRDLADTCVQGA